MGKFTEGHLEQIRMMKKEGKGYKEIKEFFKKTYNIKVWDGEIIKICREIIDAQPRGAGRKKTGPYPRRKDESGCMYTLICKLQHICKPEICKFK